MTAMTHVLGAGIGILCQHGVVLLVLAIYLYILGVHMSGDIEHLQSVPVFMYVCQELQLSVCFKPCSR